MMASGRVSRVAVGLVAGLFAAFSAVPAFAQSKSREEVRGEAASAVKAGEIDHGEATRAASAASLRPRAEVKADARAAVKAGAIDHGEVSSQAIPPKTTLKTRAEVKAEAASAIRMTPPVRPAASAASR